MTISSLTIENRVAVLTIDNPPVNALSTPVRAALLEAVTAVQSDDNVDALVIACGGKTFFAGADLKEFDAPPADPLLTETVDALEASNKPVIAAIHGSALGGGLEVAIACHYRIATAQARFGLPEVKLGLMPGSRGTQRLPRLVGIANALDMIALGNPIDTAKALEFGLIDRVSAGALVADACDFAREVGTNIRRTSERAVAPLAADHFDTFAKRNARKFRGLDAPPAIIRAVRASGELSFADGVALERKLFLELRHGPQTKALRHVFFAEREALKIPGQTGIEPRPLKSTGVIGAGTMGTGITLALLSGGLPVTLVEQSAQALERGAGIIAKTLADDVKSGRKSQADAEKAQAMLSTSMDYAALAGADLIIEAAFETMPVKQAIFTALDAAAKPGAILATNTSYLDIDQIAAATRRPRDVVGMHFFSPANIMKLLEIVRAAQTAPDAIATALAVAKRIGKVPVVAGNAYGFIGNRMLAVRRREAETMLVEGASPSQIDRVTEDFGFPMGPFRMADLAGLDLGWSAETSKASTIRERLCEAGRRGQKTGAGFYDYDADRRPTPSAVVDSIVAGFAADRGLTRREVPDTEILDRLLWPMIDEGARLFDEGIAQRVSDIDVVWINGYGWPAWTGGPMYHAQVVGIETVAARLRGLGREPSAALLKLAAQS